MKIDSLITKNIVLNFNVCFIFKLGISNIRKNYKRVGLTEREKETKKRHMKIFPKILSNTN